MNCQVDFLISSVSFGQTKRFNCPACGGKNSLTITNEGIKVSFNCFKARCTLRGHTKLTPTTEEIRQRLLNKDIKSAESFTVPDYWVKGTGSKKCLQMLVTYNCLSAYQKGLFTINYDPKEDRLVILIRNDDNQIVGAVGRTLKGQTPKTRNYYEASSQPFIVGTGDTLVCVEDCFSAIAVTNKEGYAGMPWLGTNLNEAYIKYLQRYKTIIIALDKDAKKKALDILNNLRYYHKSVKLKFLEKDIKNMTTTEINELFKD